MGLVIAATLVAGLQVIPSNVLPSTGTLQVSLASDPSTITCSGHRMVNVTSLVVTISSVSIHRTGAFNLTGDWIKVTDFPKTIDLVAIAGTRTPPVSLSLPEGEFNLVRIEVAFVNATTTSNPSPSNVIVSGGHLQAEMSTQVVSGKITNLVVRVVQPHLVCEGNGQLRLTPELTATSSGPS